MSETREDYMTTETRSEHISAGDTAYAYRTMAMGGWRWGWPRGHRTGITLYEARPDAAGVLRWYSAGLVCDGLTAANHEQWTRFLQGERVITQVRTPGRLVHRAPVALTTVEQR